MQIFTGVVKQLLRSIWLLCCGNLVWDNGAEWAAERTCSYSINNDVKHGDPWSPRSDPLNSHLLRDKWIFFMTPQSPQRSAVGSFVQRIYWKNLHLLDPNRQISEFLYNEQWRWSSHAGQPQATVVYQLNPAVGVAIWFLTSEATPKNILFNFLDYLKCYLLEVEEKHPDSAEGAPRSCFKVMDLFII